MDEAMACYSILHKATPTIIQHALMHTHVHAHLHAAHCNRHTVQMCSYLQFCLLFWMVSLKKKDRKFIFVSPSTFPFKLLPIYIFNTSGSQAYIWNGFKRLTVL